MKDELNNMQQTGIDMEAVRKKHYYRVLLLLFACIVFYICGKANSDVQIEDDSTSNNIFTESTGESSQNMSYTQISQEEAKQLMADEEGYIILDARTKEEYESGHIPGAICVPNENIGATMPEELPDKEQLILVYCRSGNRSKQASQKLADMGYSNVKEFGGIMSWDGEIER